MDSDEVTRLYHVWKTVQGMLNDRGYVVNQSNLNMNIDEFRSRFDTGSSREALTVLSSKTDEEENRIFVFFTDEAKITIPVLNTYAKRMQSERVFNAIMISRDGISSSARDGIKELQPHFQIEHFEESELMVNITKHELVPTH